MRRLLLFATHVHFLFRSSHTSRASAKDVLDGQG